MKGGIRSEVRATVEGIKEIVKGKGYSDDEIYAMFQECNMDPDETAQKLLSQDPFHEVKRKRDKKKEVQSTSIQNSVDVKARPGSQSRGGRGGSLMGRGAGRASYRPVSHDLEGGKSSNVRENGAHNLANKNINLAAAVPYSTSENAQARVGASGTSSLLVSANGTPAAVEGIPRSSITAKEDQSGAPGQITMVDIMKSSGISQLPVQSDVRSVAPVPMIQGQAPPKFQQAIALTPISASGISPSLPDPVYVPSHDGRMPGAVGTIKRAVGIVGAQRVTDAQPTLAPPSNVLEPLQSTQSSHNDVAPSDVKSSGNNSDSSAVSDHHATKSITSDADRIYEPRSQAGVSATPGAPMNNPPVMVKQYSNRIQQQTYGPQKAIGPNMEWKRKPPNQNAALSNPRVVNNSTGCMSSPELKRSPLPSSDNTKSDDAACKLQEKLERLNVRSDQHLIIPDHLQVPEAACLGLSFGSFGTFVGTSSMEFDKGGSDKGSSPLSEESQKTQESNEEPISRISDQDSESITEHQEQASPTTVDNLPSGIDARESISQNAISQSEPSKQDPVMQMAPPYSLVESAPNYVSVGLMPQMISNQYQSYEPALTSPHDASRQPSLVMQHPYDPSTSAYSQFLRPGVDGDARFSPFVGPTTVSKYNVNATMLSGSSVSTSQEIGTSGVVASAGPTAQGSQVAGIAQATMSFPHQQMQMFPQPGGVHISPFGHTYIHYPQYISPLYISPPAINSFASNIGYPQPSSGSNYHVPSVTSFPSAAAAAAAATAKYPLSQLKPMAASGNSSQTGFPVGYAGYSASPSGFSASPVVSGGNRSGFEENKETNVYIPNQQVDGSAFWFRTPQNLPSMQSSSYYSLSAQGQNVAFTPAQSGHAAYAGLYHPAQSGVAQNNPQLLQQSETLGGAPGGNNSQTGGYQQSQPGQLNWSNNY